MRKQKTHHDKAFKDDVVKLSFELKNVSNSHTNWVFQQRYCIADGKSTSNEEKTVSTAMGSVLVKTGRKGCGDGKRLKEAYFDAKGRNGSLQVG